MLTAGIDVGTQGVRAMVVDRQGNLVASGNSPLAPVAQPHPDWREQDPGDWWAAVVDALRQAVAALRQKSLGPEQIAAVAVDSTSGTVFPIDAANRPLRPAIMYNDARAQAEATRTQAAGAEVAAGLGYRFGSSFALPKILWVKEHEPGIYERAYCFVHAAEYVAACLCGCIGVGDHSNALKAGFDLLEYRWPGFIARGLGLDPGKFPRVVPPGQPLGRVTRRASEATGLSTLTVVVSGMTDGCAGQVASGALSPGDWNSTLGTTLVIKGITRDLVKDPHGRGRIYSHLHPEGHWMPGGASNTGGEGVDARFGRENLAELDRSVLQLTPSGLVVYPLNRTGERFPFTAPHATGFVLGEPQSREHLYAGYLEGVAYLERLAYEFLDQLGAPAGDLVYVTGGGSRSREWLQLRANILGKAVVKPKYSEAAMGMAIVAASAVTYANLTEAGRAMIQPEVCLEPQRQAGERYDEAYGRFRQECQERGYF